MIESLVNEKAHIKDHLVLQLISNYNFDMGFVDEQISKAEKEGEKEKLIEERQNIVNNFDTNKDYYIRTGFLSQSDFDNHYKEMKGMYQYLPNDQTNKSGISF